MTENEKVKKWFKLELSMREEESLDAIECEDMMDICVKALEEIQQYRAIGLTPTMVKDLISMNQKHHKCALENAHLLDEYQTIGTIEECRTAVERMKPKKPIIKEWCPALCPSCKQILSESKGDGYWQHYTSLQWCDCGQKLDWSE